MVPDIPLNEPPLTENSAVNSENTAHDEDDTKREVNSPEPVADEGIDNIEGSDPQSTADESNEPHYIANKGDSACEDTEPQSAVDEVPKIEFEESPIKDDGNPNSFCSGSDEGFLGFPRDGDMPDVYFQLSSKSSQSGVEQTSQSPERSKFSDTLFTLVATMFLGIGESITAENESDNEQEEDGSEDPQKGVAHYEFDSSTHEEDPQADADIQQIEKTEHGASEEITNLDNPDGRMSSPDSDIVEVPDEKSQSEVNFKGYTGTILGIEVIN